VNDEFERARESQQAKAFLIIVVSTLLLSIGCCAGSFILEGSSVKWVRMLTTILLDIGLMTLYVCVGAVLIGLAMWLIQALRK
jgi:hypothetical protein